jgi:vacuolar protein sorting-associated protein 13A/C
MHAAAPFIQSAGTLQDLTLSMNELLLVESFCTSTQLQSTLVTHYKHEATRQVFRIIGSSNLLGNPAGLMDKLSLGVYEMTRDPVIGMQQGPRGFVQGVGKGVQGLVKGVFGGGFSSLSNIAGSMYAVAQSSTGGEDTRSNKRAENLSQGLYQGASGMGSELRRGARALWREPRDGATANGVGGFVRGTAKGVVGLLTAPVKGLLRGAESVSQGVASEAENFSNIGKSKVDLLKACLVRVRECRRFDLQGRFSDYNYE